MSIKFIGIFLTVKGHHEYNPARNMVISIFHDKASKHSFINKFQTNIITFIGTVQYLAAAYSNFSNQKRFRHRSTQHSM